MLGDAIYNGAADNATGCGLLLELARAWSAQSPKPKRSAVFLAVTAEEKGLLGSKYYTRNPLIPLSKTALNLNVDMILPLGVPASVVVTGAERTSIWPTVKAAAERNRLEIETDQRAPGNLLPIGPFLAGAVGRPRVFRRGGNADHRQAE